MNQLYYGDNLGILQTRRYFPDAFVDLIYLDPPFKSDVDYNVLFAEQDGSRSHAQIRAFTDTWQWDIKAVETYEEVVERGGDVAKAMVAFRTFLGDNDMMAYLFAETHQRVLARLNLPPNASHEIIAARLQKAHPQLPRWKKLAQRFDSTDYTEGLPPGGWLRVARELIQIKSAMA